MRLRVEHTTCYRYAVPASYALLQLRVRPQTSATQTVEDWQVALEGARHQTRFTDQYGNLVDLVEPLPDAHQVDISVGGLVETRGDDGVAGPHRHSMPIWFYRRQTPLTAAAGRVRGLLKGLGDIGPDPVAGCHTLSGVIREHVAYTPGETHVGTTAEDALAQGSGVCQDHTHVFLSAARALGLPARYVSGYLMMNDRVDQEASHAWAEVSLEGLGWVGFDVSNGISPDRRYIRLAHGLDYRDVAPTSGITIGAHAENLVVSIQVQQ